jgi:23S rRNA (adenine2503-C2)-methyltransferase
MASVSDKALASITNLPLSELASSLGLLGEPKFRSRQITKWLYQRRVNSFEEMNNISQKSQQLYSENYSLKKLALSYHVQSKHKDAEKFGFETVSGDGVIESVLLYDGQRRTACISSQLGCALGCVFCETGAMGFVRNLRQDEIVGQLIGINDYSHSKSERIVTNVVFMGMGEALSNFDAFISSLHIIMSEDAFNIGARRITVSTAGVVPSIEKLMEQNLTIGLAISLNAWRDEDRNKIMPINKKYPIASLLEIAKRYSKKTNRPVTFEYVLVEGENDSPADARALVSLLKGLNCKVNVIPVNPSSGEKTTAPSERALKDFADALVNRGINATVRKSRGQDISGACGQLGKRRNGMVKGPVSHGPPNPTER